MYGDLVNLRSDAVDRRVATTFLLKCKGFSPNAYAFHFGMNSSE